jgi:hypothetical protein
MGQESFDQTREYLGRMLGLSEGDLNRLLDQFIDEIPMIIVDTQ